jgi:hypothetical protein
VPSAAVLAALVLQGFILAVTGGGQGCLLSFLMNGLRTSTGASMAKSPSHCG